MDEGKIFPKFQHLDGMSFSSTSESERDSSSEDLFLQQLDESNQTLTGVSELDCTHECPSHDQLDYNYSSRQLDPMNHVRLIQQLSLVYDHSAGEKEPIQKKANISIQSGIMRVSYKMLPPHFKRAWKLKQQQKKDGRRRNRKQCQRIAKPSVKFTITSFLGFDSEGKDAPVSIRKKAKEHAETEESEWLDLSDTEEEFDENIVAQLLNTTAALSDQTSIWDDEERDESEMGDPRRNLFTSSPKQPSSEESKRSSKDSAVGSITPTELKFSSPESDINSKTVITKEPTQLQIADDNSAIQSPFRRRRFKTIYPRKRMNASYRKRRNADPASPTHLVIESVDDQLYTSFLFNVSTLETEETHVDQAVMNLNSTPTSDKKPSKKFKLFGITFKNPFKKNSNKKGQQPKQRKEVIPGMTEEDIVQLIRDFERRKALGLVSTKCTYL